MANQLLTAFTGAAIALLLEAVYDSYQEYQKRDRLRKLIRTDLNMQVKNLKPTKKDLIDHINKYGYSDIYNYFKTLFYLNTDVFKGNSFIDYHKAYSDKNFQYLVARYSVLQELYKIEVGKHLHDVKEKYKNKEHSSTAIQELSDAEKINKEDIDQYIILLDKTVNDIEKIFNKNRYRLY